MLLGTIINKESQIYIKQNEMRNISFDKVDKEGITHLNKYEATELLNKLFNTRKQYLETKDGYDIYIDENNLKRYYKNQIEDFNMFYLNNGIDATAYLGKGLKAAIKSFTFTVGALATTVLITTQGIEALQDYSTGKINGSAYTIDTNTDYFEPVTLEHLKSYIYSSEGLTNFDKEILYNEDYLSFVLSISDNERKLFDFNDRFRNINIQEYTEEEYPWADGYYTPGTNTIHILNEDRNDMELLKDTMTHEFVHLTQAKNEYRYIREALAEIMTDEFYDTTLHTYQKTVKNVKVLMEIIGPAPVLNAAYSYDTTIFKNAIRQYLNEDDTKVFLQLMRFHDFGNPGSENIIHERISMYLTKMIDNKYEQGMEKYDEQWKNKTTIETRDRDYDKKVMTEILEGRAQHRMYFNKNKKEYYDDIHMDGDPYKYDERIECNDFKELLSLGNPESIEITYVSIPKEKFTEYLKIPEFVNFINSVRDIDFLKSGKMEYTYYSSLIKNKFNRTSSKGYPTTFDNPEEYVNSGQYIKDILDIINNSGVDEIEISPSISSKKIILSIEDFEKLKPIFSENNTKVKINFKESNSTLDSASTTLGDLNNKSKTAILHRSEYVSIPSIYEKFGEQIEEYAHIVNPEVVSRTI